MNYYYKMKLCKKQVYPLVERKKNKEIYPQGR